MSGPRLSFFPLAPALAIALMLATGAGIAAAETADESRLRQLAGQAESYANEVRALLAKGASANVPDRDGRTAVHGAARISAVETMRALLAAGGNPNRRDKDGNTPLHLASAAARISGYLATIRLLLAADADPGIANGQGLTPLHIAVTVPEQPAAVEALLAHGADANRRDLRGSTPLHAALGPNPGGPGWSGGPGAGTPDVVGPLLAKGADPRIVNGDGLTALQLFVREGASGRTAALLLEAGADPDRKYPDGDAPLHAAIRSGGSRGKVEVVKALLAGGADPCVRDAKRYTPYHIAPEGGAIRYDLGLAGGGDLACDGRGEAVALDSEERRQIQEALAGAGFDPGPADGEFGPRTRRAIEGWQQANGYAATAELTSAQVEALLADAPPKPLRPNWSIVENQPCQVWNSSIPEKLEPFTWSGPCVDGKASGDGRLTVSGIGASYQGGMADGKRHGHGTTSYASGNRYEGEYRDGKRHGHGTYTYADGDRYEGEWRDGKYHGQGTKTWADGGRYEGEYRNGKKHGTGVYRFSDGDISEGPYVRGKRHGQWITRYQDGHVFEGTYTDGKLHGPAVFRRANGDVEERNYVNGKAHGRFVTRKADGTVETYWMHHGKLQENK